MGDDLTNVHKNACQTFFKSDCKDNKCVKGTECCQEPHSKMVTCCAPGACNHTTGHCSNRPTESCPKMVEGYDGGDGGQCDNWKNAMILLIFLVLVLGFGFIVVGLKCRELMANR